MKTPLIIFSLLFLFFSCKKEYKNPYDRECPADIWTPKNLNAVIDENGIAISWEQGETHIDGFMLEKSFDSLIWSPVNDILIDKIIRGYTDTITYSSPMIYYRIFARADLNISDKSNSKGLKYMTEPVCSTHTATNVSATGATLNGTVNANNLSTAVTFEYGLTISYGNTIISSQSPVTGNVNASATADISGLSPGTTYHCRLKVVNSLGTSFGNDVTFKTSEFANCGTVTDIDGNVYNTISIGTQCWLRENLKTTKYNDGTAITLVTSADATWETITTPAYCWYNDLATNKEIYGALYNWYTLDLTINGSKNVCPVGWHVPTNDEWSILIKSIDPLANPANVIQSEVAGGKLKESGISHWITPNTGATNESGFTALPGGQRYNSEYGQVGQFGVWWSSNEYSAPYAWCWIMYFERSDAIRGYDNKIMGKSVRCLRDP